MVRENFNTRPRNFIRPKSGYEKFSEIISNHDFPLTMHISGLKMNGVYTIHADQQVNMYKCLTTSSNVIYLPVESNLEVVATQLVDNVHYATVNELRKHKKEESIDYFVSTKNICVDGKTYYEEGQVFVFSPSTLLRSFKRERKRGINVLIYPEMTKEFLSLELVGNFMKCLPPFTTTIKFLTLSMYPFYIKLSKVDKNLQLKFNSKNLLVIEKKQFHCYFASNKKNGQLTIDAFTVNRYTHVRLLERSKTVDFLDSNELSLVLKSFDIPHDERLENYLFTYTYHELGIIRLLDEIITELKYERPPTVDLIERKLLFENEYESLGILKQNILMKKQNISNRHPFGYSSKSRDFIQNVDGSIHMNDKSCHIYVNDSPLNDEVKNAKELIVDFDTGGYVAIPFVDKPPAITFNKGDLYYKSCENKGYVPTDVEKISDVDVNIDYHVYSYIATDYMCIGKNGNNNYYNPGNLLDNPIKQSSKKICKPTLLNKDTTELSGAHSSSYDYTYTHQSSLKKNPLSISIEENSKNELSTLAVDEISDLLRSLSLKHFVTKFREKTINGAKLIAMDEKMFLDLGLTRFEARKLYCYVNGWRAMITSSIADVWFSKSVTQWLVIDVTKYLLHINMRSLLRFVTQQNIDGRLLIEISKDDTIKSLRTEHGVMFRENEIERLKKYILEDDKTKFRHIK